MGPALKPTPLAYFFGFILQNTTLIKITIITTTAMDTQNPIFNPSHSHVPKETSKFYSNSYCTSLQKLSIVTNISFFQACCQLVTNNKKTTSCTLFHAICRFLFKILVSTFLAQSIQQRVQIIKHYVLSYMPMQQ